MDIAEPNPTLFKGTEKKRVHKAIRTKFAYTFMHKKKPSASNLNIENKKQTAFVKKIGARCAYWCEALDVQGTLKVEITAQRADEEKGLLKLRAVIFLEMNE